MQTHTAVYSKKDLTDVTILPQLLQSLAALKLNNGYLLSLFYIVSHYSKCFTYISSFDSHHP